MKLVRTDASSLRLYGESLKQNPLRQLIFLGCMLTFLFLTGCGFHLRGISNVPQWLNNVAIISVNNDKQFVSILKSRLETAKLDINADPLTAQYWIMLNEVDLQQQIISVGASTNPRQYTLTLTVLFAVQTRKGQIIDAPGRIVVYRELTINNDRILGSKDEENILIGEMKQDAVTQLIYRLSHLKKPMERKVKDKPLN